MRNRTLSSQLQSINRLFSQVATFTGSSIEMQSHWAKYLCILSAGFLENAISEIYVDYVKGKANDQVASYAIFTLNKIQNPKTPKFVDTARAFNEEWAEDLQDYLDDQGRKEAINSIMGNRHRIAHGKSSDITVSRLRQWFDKAVDVVEFIETQLQT